MKNLDNAVEQSLVDFEELKGINLKLSVVDSRRLSLSPAIDHFSNGRNSDQGPDRRISKRGSNLTVDDLEKMVDSDFKSPGPDSNNENIDITQRIAKIQMQRQLPCYDYPFLDTKLSS